MLKTFSENQGKSMKHQALVFPGRKIFRWKIFCMFASDEFQENLRWGGGGDMAVPPPH